jgi:hypothetical protein
VQRDDYRLDDQIIRRPERKLLKARYCGSYPLFKMQLRQDRDRFYQSPRQNALTAPFGQAALTFPDHKCKPSPRIPFAKRKFSRPKKELGRTLISWIQVVQPMLKGCH